MQQVSQFNINDQGGAVKSISSDLTPNQPKVEFIFIIGLVFIIIFLSAHPLTPLDRLERFTSSRGSTSSAFHYTAALLAQHRSTTRNRDKKSCDGTDFQIRRPLQLNH
jgi:hypothetical protein